MAKAEIDSAGRAAYWHNGDTVNYNPYSPPTASQSAYAANAGTGQAQPWSSSEAVSLGWARFKDAWPVLVGSYFVMTLIVGGLGQVPAVLTVMKVVEPASSGYYLVLAASTVVSQCVGAFLQVGLLRVWLDAARGNPLSFGVLFSGGDRFLPMLGATILMLLAIGLGLVLLIVPGIIVSLGFFAAGFFVVDAEMGPIEALKASWAVTKGQKMNIFGLALAGVGLAIVGMLMCCVGFFATLPIYGVASAIVFVRLTGRGVAQAAPPGEPDRVGRSARGMISRRVFLLAAVAAPSCRPGLRFFRRGSGHARRPPILPPPRPPLHP